MHLDKGIDEKMLQHAAHEARYVSHRDRLNIYITVETHGFEVIGHCRDAGSVSRRVSFEAAKSDVTSPLIVAIEGISLKLRTARAELSASERETHV